MKATKGLYHQATDINSLFVLTVILLLPDEIALPLWLLTLHLNKIYLSMLVQLSWHQTYSSSFLSFN
jgi:hypothetical protein